MIVFDENVHQQRLMETVAVWYHGRVALLRVLQSGIVSRDDAMSALL